MRYRLRTLLIILMLGPPVLAGLYSIGYLGWARSQGVPTGTDGAVLREMERARQQAATFDPAIHAYPWEDGFDAEERQKKAKAEAATLNRP